MRNKTLDELKQEYETAISESGIILDFGESGTYSAKLDPKVTFEEYLKIPNQDFYGNDPKFKQICEKFITTKRGIR